MFSKSVQAGWKFSDEDKDVFFANQIAVFYSESCSTFEDRAIFLRDIDKMIKSCTYAKGPSATICHYYKGITLWKHSKPDEALTSFRTSLKLTANTPVSKLKEYLGQHQIFTQIGMCHHDMKNYKLAIGFFDKVIAHYNQNDSKSLKEGLRAMYQRGLSLKMMGKLDEASTALESFINFMETNRLAAELRHTSEFQNYVMIAEEVSSRLLGTLRRTQKMSSVMKLKNEPERLARFNEANQVYSKGLKLYEKDRFLPALEAFKKCHEIKLEVFKGVLPRTDFEQIHTILGMAFDKLEMHQEAIEHFTMTEDCMRRKKDHVLNDDKAILCTTTSKLAGSYDKLNYYPESLHFWQKAAELSMVNMNDGLAKAYFNIARISFRMHEYEDALKAFHKYLRCDKSEEILAHQCLICMAKCYLKIGKYKKSLECVERGFKYLHSHPDLRDFGHIFKDLKGRCLLEMDKPEEALNHLREANAESVKIMLDQYNADKDNQFHIDSEILQNSAPFIRNKLYQVKCLRKIDPLYNHPDFLQLFKNFCTCEVNLKIISDAFTFEGESDQELTRGFLDFFVHFVMNEQLPLRFLSKNRNGVKRFHNSALISDYFRHISTKKSQSK